MRAAARREGTSVGALDGTVTYVVFVVVDLTVVVRACFHSARRLARDAGRLRHGTHGRVKRDRLGRDVADGAVSHGRRARG